jgi:transcriptional regulatory protein LevR
MTETASDVEREFEERLDLLQESGQITPLARRLTEIGIAEVANELGLHFTEENAAQFVTHVAVALTRLNRGESEAVQSDVVDEEIVDRQRELAAMTKFARDCERLLGRSVPHVEIAYMTVHVCAIADGE